LQHNCRLIGNENRYVADGSEIDAGNCDTALFAVALRPNVDQVNGIVQLRWEDPDTRQVLESAQTAREIRDKLIQWPGRGCGLGSVGLREPLDTDCYSSVRQLLLRSPRVAEWPALQLLLVRAAGGRPRDWQLPLLACEAAGGRPERAVPVAAPEHPAG
jgi:hypothetical protein